MRTLKTLNIDLRHFSRVFEWFLGIKKEGLLLCIYLSIVTLKLGNLNDYIPS